jgi:hypothetical protein
VPNLFHHNKSDAVNYFFILWFFSFFDFLCVLSYHVSTKCRYNSRTN